MKVRILIVNLQVNSIRPATWVRLQRSEWGNSNESMWPGWQGVAAQDLGVTPEFQLNKARSTSMIPKQALQMGLQFQIIY